MFTKIKNCIRSNVTVQHVVYTTAHELAYAPLPALLPLLTGKNWEWAHQRGFTAMLVTEGYVKGKCGCMPLEHTSLGFDQPQQGV